MIHNWNLKILWWKKLNYTECRYSKSYTLLSCLYYFNVGRVQPSFTCFSMLCPRILNTVSYQPCDSYFLVSSKNSLPFTSYCRKMVRPTLKILQHRKFSNICTCPICSLKSPCKHVLSVSQDICLPRVFWQNVAASHQNRMIGRQFKEQSHNTEHFSHTHTCYFVLIKDSNHLQPEFEFEH